MEKIFNLVFLILIALIISCNNTFINGIDSNNPSPSDDLTDNNEIIVYISTATGNKELWQMNNDGSKKVQVTYIDNPDWNLEYPRISPDMKKVVMKVEISGSGSFTYTVGINGYSLPLTKVSDLSFTQAGGGDWYSDSEFLAYSGGPVQYDYDIYRVKFDGTGHTLLFDQSLVSRLYLGYPVIDRTNSRYSFNACDSLGTNCDVYTVDFDLSNLVKIVDLYSNVTNWFPDGSGLIYAYYTGTWNFRYCNYDGSGSTQVPNLGNVNYLALSPDMNYILYNDGSGNLYKADFPDGTNPALLATQAFSGDWK